MLSCSNQDFVNQFNIIKNTEITRPMIPSKPSYLSQGCPQLNQPSATYANDKKRRQQTSRMEMMTDFSMNEELYQPLKSFLETKLKIESQMYKTLSCLSQKNKQNLLAGMDKCKLLKKDSNIFLENIQSLKKDRKESPQEIQKYLSLQTGGQLSDEQRKWLL